MSREFGVEFLGSIPLDGQWGVLIEEGKRPRYGITNVPTEARDNEEDSRDEEEMEKGENDKENREEGLLIDKYRSCSLCPVFEGIVKQIIDTVTNRTSVSVKAPNA